MSDAPGMYGIGEAGIYLSTGDIAAAADWYEDVLGMEALHGADHYRFLDMDADGTARQRLILFDPTHTAEQDTPAPHGTGDATHVALDVPRNTIEDWRARLAEHDVEITYERDWPDGAHSLYFDDPAGNSLELMGIRTDPLPGAWDAPPLALRDALDGGYETVPDAYREEWDALDEALEDRFAEWGGVEAIGAENAYTVATIKIGAYLSGHNVTYNEAAGLQGFEKDAGQLSQYACELKDAMGLDERLHGDPVRTGEQA